MPSNLNVLGTKVQEMQDSNCWYQKRRNESTKVGYPSAKSPSGPNSPAAVELTAEEREAKRQEREARKEEKAAAARNLIIVGVDFGTTYTGIAWGSTKKTWNDIVVITHWNGGSNDNTEKVPSRIAYAEQNGFDQNKWGYGIKPGSKLCQWFKLWLDARNRREDFDDPRLQKVLGSKIMSLPEGKTAQGVTTDFLRYVYQHLLHAISQEIGPALVDQTSFRFVVTHPATWSLAARQATRTAAEDAGFGTRAGDDITMIAEPEAAAICAITQTNARFSGTPFKKSTCFIGVDIGGGTVDVSTFLITKMQPLKLEEACGGEGAKVGGTSVDRALHELMQEWFDQAFENLDITKVCAGSHFMDVFEARKREFTGDIDEDSAFELPLKLFKLDKDDPKVIAHYDFDEDRVRISGQEMERMFATMLENTFKLIRSQLEKTRVAEKPPVVALVLSGGMGSSPYVHKRMQEFVREELQQDIEVVVPSRGWSAICRGAAISLFEKNIVAFRIAREHIGFTVHEEFDEGKHLESDRYECPIEGSRAKNQMRWHVQKNETIQTNLKRPIDCYAVVHGTHLPKVEYVVYQDLYGSSEDRPPSRVDHPLRESGPIFKVGNIKIDLTKVVEEERKRLLKSRKKVPRRMAFDLTLEMTLGSEKGVLTITAKKGRRKFGEAHLEFDQDPAFDGTLVSSRA